MVQNETEYNMNINWNRVKKLANFTVNTGKTRGKWPRINKLPLRGIGMAAIPKMCHFSARPLDRCYTHFSDPNLPCKQVELLGDSFLLAFKVADIRHGHRPTHWQLGKIGWVNSIWKIKICGTIKQHFLYNKVSRFIQPWWLGGRALAS